MHVHQIQSVGKFAKKSCHNWLTWSEYIAFSLRILRCLVNHWSYVNTQDIVSKVFDDISFVVLKAYLWCGAGKKTILLQNSGFIQRPVEREQKTAENSFCIRNSAISKTFKKCRQKTSTCLRGSFLGAFLLFFVFEVSYHQFHITKKSETCRTCWH